MLQWMVLSVVVQSYSTGVYHQSRNNEASRNFGTPFRLLDCEDRTPSLVLDRYAMENRPRSWY